MMKDQNHNELVVDEKLVTFDTSVFLAYVKHELGLELNVDFSIEDVLEVIKENKVVILTDMAEEMENHIMKRRYFESREGEAMAVLEKYKKINPQHYGLFLYDIQKEQKGIASHPEYDKAKGWIWNKRWWLSEENGIVIPENWGDMENMDEKEIKKALEHLSKKAKNDEDKDNIMLAKAMKYVQDYKPKKMYFATNDADHVVMEEHVREETNGRLEIWRPPRKARGT